MPINKMSDPAVNLGPSIFLHILSFLPFDDILRVEQVCSPWREVVRTYEKSIWKQVALNDANPDLHLLELSLSSTPSSGGAAAASAQASNPDIPAPSTAVPWRKACEDAIMLDRNWRFGRCREHWITTPGDAVWRFKIDEKQGTCLATNRRRTGGLHVVDVETSEPLFSIQGVHDHAHLEFVAGHAIFDVGGANFSLEVYRTADAIAASRHRNPATRSLLSRTSTSFSHPDWTPGAEGPLPRGHLEYYKTITPPTPCHAFRARLDHAGTKDQKALLATAGISAVYIWDMEEPDPLKKETILIDEEDQEEISYVEFDEDYVFLCRPWTGLILSRKTKHAVYNFPGSDDWCRVHKYYQLPTDFTGPDRLQSRAPPGRSSSTGTGGDPRRKPMRQCVPIKATVTYNHEEDFRDNVMASMYNLFADLGFGEQEFPEVEWEWNACHYTRNDLHVSSMGGVILTIRDYRKCLAIEDTIARHRELAGHTIWNSVVYASYLLATTPTRMVSSAVEQILFWNPTDFPPLHLDSTPPPPSKREHTKCQAASLVAYLGLNDSSCLQVDHKRIYVTYLARVDEGHEADEVPADYPKIGNGWAIKCWDFSN